MITPVPNRHPPRLEQVSQSLCVFPQPLPKNIPILTENFTQYSTITAELSLFHQKFPVIYPIPIKTPTFRNQSIDATQILVENGFNSQKLCTFSEANSNTERASLQISKFSDEYKPKKILKRSAYSQIQVETIEKETETFKLDSKEIETQTWVAQEDQDVNTTQNLYSPIIESKLDLKPRSNSFEIANEESEESLSFHEEKKIEEDKVEDVQTCNFLRISQVNVTNSEISVNVVCNQELILETVKPLSCLFLSASDVNFQDVLGSPRFSQSFFEIYSSVASTSNMFNDSIFNSLSSWVLGTYISDFVIFLIDFSALPDLHHSDIILKYFIILTEIDRPLIILHKTSETVTYEYSFTRINELLESLSANDKVLLHEEITDNIKMNLQKFESIKDQMNDNLYDPDQHFELSETVKIAFECTIEKILSIQNSRKRELLIKGEKIIAENLVICKSDLENSWKVVIRENLSQSALKNLIYVSPAHYHIDENISTTIYSTHLPSVQDNFVKISVFSNLPAEKLSHVYLSDLSYCFTKNKEDTLLIFPSSRVIRTSISNHINTSEFNSVFLHKFLERIADCLIISLFYDSKFNLIEPSDKFLGLQSMLKIRQVSKPVLIFYQFFGSGEMQEYSNFFNQAVKSFDEMISEWTGSLPISGLQVHESSNEGIYAFDSQKQIIHRLIVPGAELIWKWYNGVLYKIMHNASINNKLKPLSAVVVDAFASTLKESVSIIDDEAVVNPDVQSANYLEKSWKALSSFSMTVYSPLSPSWLIQSK